MDLRSRLPSCPAVHRAEQLAFWPQVCVSLCAKHVTPFFCSIQNQLKYWFLLKKCFFLFLNVTHASGWTSSPVSLWLRIQAGWFAIFVFCFTSFVKYIINYLLKIIRCGKKQYLLWIPDPMSMIALVTNFLHFWGSFHYKLTHKLCFVIVIKNNSLTVLTCTERNFWSFWSNHILFL